MRTMSPRVFLVTLLCSTLILTVWSFHPIPLRTAKSAAAFGVITVTTANDFFGEDGHCSLREAIMAANTNVQVFECLGAKSGLDTIQFNLGEGTPVINITEAGLPEITEPVVIDGATGGAVRVELNGTEAGPDASGLMVNSSGGVTLKSLVINRFQVFGIFLRSNGNVIQNCFIGTNATGMVALGNMYDGILLEASSNNIIGGTSPGQGNVISGNGSAGIELGDSNNNVIQGNFIGTDVTGAGALGNSQGGIHFDGESASSSGNTIGGTAANAGNTIAFNGGNGVLIKRASALNNRLSSNAIFSNGVLGIELVSDTKASGLVTDNDADDPDTGPNNLQNFPVLTNVSAVGLISGSLDSTTDNSAYPVRLEFFANTTCDASGNGEGEVYLGSTMLAAPGNFGFNATLIQGKNFITATATDNNGNTSEFSACRLVNVNLAPTIEAGPSLARQQASPGFNSQIATVSDAEQAANTLIVQVNEGPAATVNGVTVSNLVINANGQVTADVVAACAATDATFTLKVIDNLNAFNTATLTVNVTDNSLPTLGYVAQTVAAGDSLMVNPASGPNDNGLISSIAVLSQGTYTGTVNVNNSTGVVSFSNAQPGGIHTITIRVTDNCNVFTDASFTLEVICPTIYLGPAALPSGTTTAFYTETITANGGVGPYTFNIARVGNPPPWLSLSSGGVLSGQPESAGVFNFIIRAVDANGCEGSRAYTLLINCVTIAPASRNFTASGGTGTISLSAPGGCTWTAVSNDSWITVTSGGSGAGNGTVSYSVAANAGNAPRTGTITIGSNLFSVQQSAPGVVLEEELSAGLPPGWVVVDEGIGGGNAATWTTTNPCSQSFPALITPPFLSVDVSCSGPGSSQDEQLILPPLDLRGLGRVLLRFNTQFKLDLGPTHTGDVDVSLDGGMIWVNVLRVQTADPVPVTKTVDLTAAIAPNPANVLIRFHYYGQLPNRLGPAKGGNRPTGGSDVIWPIDNLLLQSFTISPFNVNVGVAGGTGSVNVDVANTTVWTARSHDNWITVLTSGGTGSGSADYTVAANLTGIPRTGTITIAENTFTVQQAACATLTVTPANLNAGTVRVSYNQSLSVSGGSAPYNFSILNGALPIGLSLSTEGVLAGLPGQTGTFNFTVLAQDAVGCTGTQAYTLTITCPAITVNPVTLGPATAGAAFNQTFTQTGGNGAIAWSFTGVLPAGLTLNPATGELTGTPTVTGSFNFTIVATDANNCTGSRAYTLSVGCSTITLAPTSLPVGTAGALYSQTLTQTGGNGVIAWSFTGMLPTGLMLNATTGALVGMPTTTGNFNFTVIATDANNCVGSQAYTVTIGCPTITLTPGTLPNGVVGTAYNQTFSASPAGTYEYSVTSGNLPSGLTLNSSTGLLSGTPTTTGTANFTITATVFGTCVGSQSYVLTINCSSITVSPATLGAGTVGSAFSQSFTQTGGNGVIAWSFTGALPKGMTLKAEIGELTGTPTEAGKFNFTIIATDTNNCTGSRAYALTINCPAITLTPETLLPGGVGVAYQQTVSASPAGAYSYAVTAGSLPSGLTLNSATGVLSGIPTAAGTANFTITATGLGACTGSQAYVVTINCSAVVITPLTLPSGSEGAPYNQALEQTGATGTVAWSLRTGALPNGLSLDTKNGVLSGATLAAGTFNFTVRATGSNGCFGEQAYALVVANCPTLTLTPGILPTVRIGNPFSQILTGSGGQAPYNFSVTTGALPMGITLTTNGLMAGAPTKSGAFTFTVTVRDANNCSGTQGYTLVVERGLVHADFDRDGRTDLSVWRPGTGTWYSFKSSDARAQAQNWGAGYAPYHDVIVPGDYDGDGQTDYAVWRGQTSTWYIQPSAAPATPIVREFGASYAPYFDVPVQGDYDGDKRTDIAVWRPADGKWYILKSSDGNSLVEAWGTPGDIPVPGDYDGDGKVDLAQWRPSTGVWYIKKSSGGTQTMAWGAGVEPYLDVPVPADYDGDGKTDIAVWRKQDSNWYIRKSTDGATLTYFFGAPYVPYNDIAVPGDYDGDGKADIAVWRSSDGTWYVLQSADNMILVKVFGQAGDMPIPAYGVR